jgi:hypothetical protein
MLIVKVQPEANGAHANQYMSGMLDSVPEGWALVPEENESAAMAMLPWITVSAADGIVNAFEENTAAKQAYEKEQEALNELNK